MKNIRCLPLGCFAAALLLSGALARAQGSFTDAQLVQRFRPYIKTSLDQGRDEPFHPANWQWIARASNMNVDGKLYRAAGTWTPDELNRAAPFASFGAQTFIGKYDGQTDPKIELVLASESSRAGEPWAAVIHQGHGIYAHLEHFPDSLAHNTLVNIEYTILWPHNAALGSNHDGDITTVVIVYDQIADRIKRITYSIHGCILQSYEPAEPRTFQWSSLTGKDENSADSVTDAVRVNIADPNSGAQGVDLCGGFYTSDQYFYIVADPVSHLYEHVVLFAEEGSHELWPNPSGWVSLAPAHPGDGVSFLPDTVQILGTIVKPTTCPSPVDEDTCNQPFLYYNGKFGNDPQAIAIHKTWFWPGGRDRQNYLDVNRFSDNDPYKKFSDLPWPPVSFSGVPSPVYVVPRPSGALSTQFDGSITSPIRGFALAYSVAPQGSTLILDAGAYAEPVVLDRKMLIIVSRGPAILGTRR